MSCSNAGLATQQSRRVFQTTSEVFYGTKHELCPQNVAVSASQLQGEIQQCFPIYQSHC